MAKESLVYQHREDSSIHFNNIVRKCKTELRYKVKASLVKAYLKYCRNTKSVKKEAKRAVRSFNETLFT